MEYFPPTELKALGMNQTPKTVSPLPPRAESSTSNATAASSSLTAAPPTRIRRRNRMITSCLECRRRKLKCDKLHPCTNCTKFARDCVFLAPALDQASQLKLTEIKEKVGSLERLLEREAQTTKAQNQAQAQVQNPSIAASATVLPDDSFDDLPANEDELTLEPTPLAVVDAAYEADGEDDDLLDLGISLGKMRITERIGGFFRPRISEELNNTVTNPKNYKKGEDTSRREIPLPPASEWLKPGPAFIMPSSGFFFGSGNHPASLIDFLPSRLAADRLIKQYFACVHPLCQIVHRPTFEREYDAFWDEVSLGIEPPSPVQTVVFAAMFSGVVSMDEATILRDFGVGKSSLMDNFKLGTETALSRAGFLRTTKVETLQGFVMYLIPLCRSELSRAHSVLVGAAIRMAECMGLHRDGSAYGMNPLETHTRRLIWHQLCFLDIRTCESQGPRPTIRREEFDTKLPLNCDDIEFHPSGPLPSNADRWTDTTLSLIRFEINEMMRTIWTDRPKIEARKISLTAVLSKIETFRAKMAAKYDHLLDERVPIQKCARLLKALLISRLHIMVLHRYHNSVVSPMPARLRTIMLSSGTTTLEMAILLETDPDLKPWTWYGGAVNQYHTAFLILMEVFTHPHRSGVAATDRMWACLDYVFETSPEEPRNVKGKKVLGELQQKMAVYQSLRGMRAPTTMGKYVGAKVAPWPADRTGSPIVFENSEGVERETGNADGFVDLNKPVDRQPFVGKVAVSAPVMEGMRQGGPPAQSGMQYAGVSNGETLWALPAGRQISPGSGSDGVSAVGGMTPMTPGGGGDGIDDLMADIDWDAFDALFPPEHIDMTGSGFQLLPSTPYY